MHSSKRLNRKDSSPQKAKPSTQKTSAPNQTVRLNKFIAHAGVCSRRDADSLIRSGMIKVNNTVVIEMGFQVKQGDKVHYGEKLLSAEKTVYVLLNKPRDFITTTNDPMERKTVMSLVEKAANERIYPVGRLDRNTTGLLLLTNDGELSKKLTHPSHEVSKVYQVTLDLPLNPKDLDVLSEGVDLDDGFIKVDDIAPLDSSMLHFGVEIHSGRNRIVRRIFEKLGYEVLKLDRVMFAGLTKKDLPRGKWRFLREKEIVRLKYLK
jgi:23S rRNA pseudouridine2605 synthase